MALQEVKFKLIGTAPLMYHNGDLANPANPWSIESKKISSRRNKTEEDFAELARLEWFGGQYLDDDGLITMPADVLLACLLKGAKQFKLGLKFSAGVFEVEQFHPLIFDGPRDPVKLFDDKRFVDQRMVVVNRGPRVMRTRPIYREWSVDFGLFVNMDVIDVGDVKKLVERAGEVVGFCEHRPRYGRFMLKD